MPLIDTGRCRRTCSAAAFGAAFLATPILAQDGSSASAQGVASAGIVQPITVRALEDLQFGTLAVGPDAGGSITVDPATGSVTYGGALRGVCGSGGCEARPAVFAVVGEPGRRYRIEAPPTAIANPIAGSGSSLPVVDIRVAVTRSLDSAAVGLLDALGEDRFRLGGTLQVAAGSAAGSYRADVQVVVTYD